MPRDTNRYFGSLRASPADESSVQRSRSGDLLRAAYDGATVAEDGQLKLSPSEGQSREIRIAGDRAVS